nr:lysosomal Pro-X carboxypeptidase [Ipomoea batatas]
MLRLTRLSSASAFLSSRSSLMRQDKLLIPLISQHNPPYQCSSTRFLDIYQLGNKAAIEKERARLTDEMSRGYFADMSEMKKHGGKIAMANKIIIPAISAVKFPALEVAYSNGSSLKLPSMCSGKDTDADVPRASLLCLSFRASSEVSFIDSWLLSRNPMKKLLLRVMRKPKPNGREDVLQRQITYSFGDHYEFRKELKILNLLTGVLGSMHSPMATGKVFLFQWLLLLAFLSVLVLANSHNLPGFRHSFATFPQMYMMDSTHWGGADKNAPIFVFLGLEESLDESLKFVGFLSQNAPRFKALIVYIEHRFYGKSVPFVTQEEALKNDTLRGYFNSAQALADYAEVLVYLKKKLSATYSPVIVIGASYGGMLATWFRLKYPHIAVGALASSAPLLYLDEIVPQDAFFNTIANDFVLVYYLVATLDTPPTYPLDVLCRGIDGVKNVTDVLDRIVSGLIALEGEKSCYVNITEMQLYYDQFSGSNWQMCSDWVMTINFNNDATVPPPPFNLDRYVKQCESFYGVPPRPHWMTTYFGGHDMKLVLKRFGSNIIFTNGLRDPWSGGGILKDISYSLVAVVTKNGTHALDLFKAEKSDPDWLVKQRNTSLKIIKGWIKKYYEDLRELNLK